MQTPHLELSNIVLKEQHYLPEPSASLFNFELQPITHLPKRKINLQQKMVLRQKELRDRKQFLQNSQRIRKQLLLKKIAAKNERFELRKKAEKENLKSPQIPCFIKAKNNLGIENARSLQKAKFELNDMHKVYKNQPKVPFSSTKGFTINKGNFEVMRRTHNQGEENDAFRQIQLRALKLPQLSYGCQKVSKVKQESNQMNRLQQRQLEEKGRLGRGLIEESANPLLKIHDIRYFGVEQRTQDFLKMGKSLLKQMRKKYWCYDSLDNEQVYNNFESLLLDELV